MNGEGVQPKRSKRWGRTLTLLWRSLRQGAGGTMSSPNALCALVIPNVRHGMGDWRANAPLFWKAVGVAGWWHFLFISPKGTKPGCRARGHVIPTSCLLSWAMDPKSLLLLNCHKHIQYLQKSDERWQVSTVVIIVVHFPTILWASWR